MAPPNADVLDLEHLVARAVERVLSGVEPADRAQAIRELRTELEHCLSEAPISDDVVGSIRLRAHLAAALDKAISQSSQLS